MKFIQYMMPASGLATLLPIYLSFIYGDYSLLILAALIVSMLAASYSSLYVPSSNNYMLTEKFNPGVQKIFQKDQNRL